MRPFTPHAARVGSFPMRVFLLLATIAAAGCGDDDSTGGRARAGTRDVVAVASGPAFHLATLAAGSASAELVPAPGMAPATWRPSDEQLEQLISAKKVLLMGADFEPWTQRAGLPPSRVATVADHLPESLLITVGTIEHTHGTGPAHSHGGPVPTLWTDPDAWVPLIEAAHSALDATGPAELPEGLREQLELYRTALADLRDAAGGRAVIATDHGLEYIARAADFEVRVALLEPRDGAPTNQRGVLQAEAFSKKNDDTGVLVWIDHPPLEDFGRVAEESLGLTSVHFDTGAAPTGELDTVERARSSVERLASAIRARAK